MDVLSAKDNQVSQHCFVLDNRCNTKNGPALAVKMVSRQRSEALSEFLKRSIEILSLKRVGLCFKPIMIYDKDS